MGYYYTPGGGPPQRPGWRQRLGKYVPGGIKSCWEDTQEVAAITWVVFSIISPVIGVLVAFVLTCALSLYVFAWFTGS